MSRLSNTGAVNPPASPRCVHWLVGVLLCASSSVFAGIDVGPPAKGKGRSGAVTQPAPPAQAASDSAAVSGQPAGRARQVLRCWQEGKLILETNAVAVHAPLGTSDGLTVRSAETDGNTLLLLDFRQALCALETPSWKE
ncbi:MAG: hypothetical protein AB3X44_12005 [Leptothrix sp. (in: b-proteobacteria)]